MFMQTKSKHVMKLLLCLNLHEVPADQWSRLQRDPTAAEIVLQRILPWQRLSAIWLWGNNIIYVYVEKCTFFYQFKVPAFPLVFGIYVQPLLSYK